MLGTPNIYPKFFPQMMWWNFIGCIHSHNNEAPLWGPPCRFINHPIKFRHLLSTSFGNKFWGKNLESLALPLLKWRIDGNVLININCVSKNWRRDTFYKKIKFQYCKWYLLKIDIISGVTHKVRVHIMHFIHNFFYMCV